jgi:hypothetical protein
MPTQVSSFSQRWVRPWLGKNLDGPISPRPRGKGHERMNRLELAGLVSAALTVIGGICLILGLLLVGAHASDTQNVVAEDAR